jgi:hypothetical protein
LEGFAPLTAAEDVKPWQKIEHKKEQPHLIAGLVDLDPRGRFQAFPQDGFHHHDYD